MAEFKGKRGKDVGFFVRRKRIIEQLRLIEVLLEFSTSNTLLDPRDFLFKP